MRQVLANYSPSDEDDRIGCRYPSVSSNLYVVLGISNCPPSDSVSGGGETNLSSSR